jgi:hypothetical protein
MTSPSLRDAIAKCEVRHPKFNEVFDVISSRISAALRGASPKITWVIGPSRIGKTQLTQAIARAFPPSVTNGSREVPVVVADAPGSTTLLLLPMSVLEALNVPFRRTNTSAGKLAMDMHTQLNVAGTKGIVFDEASQLVEPGTRVEPFAASEWFKQTDNKTGIVQLRMRSYKKIVWRPYDASVATDRENYMASVNTFLGIFVRAGWTFAPPLEAISANCYLQAPGLVGALSDLLKELAGQLDGEQPREITLGDFRAAASELESSGHPDHLAFVKENVTLVELTRAYQHTLTANAMT